MAGKFRKIVSILLFATIVMKFPAKVMPRTTISDQILYGSPPPPSECPYPCLPPPTATTICPPPPSPPQLPATPPPPSGSGYYPPPSGYYPPPTGYLPYYPPPAYPNHYTPPPPDPLLPYFPFYFRQPPLPPGFSSTTAPRRSTDLILRLLLLVFIHKLM